MKQRIVAWLFRMLFKGYLFPFEKLNEKILAMDETRRRNYFATAKELLENEVFNDVLKESTRKFYQELSVKIQGPDNLTAYRTTLIWINDFEKKIKELSLLFREFKPEELDKLN